VQRICVEDLQLTKLSSPDCALTVVQQNKELPYAMSRVFFVTAPKGAHRGKHAHKKLHQFLICTHGSCEVICDDGNNKRIFLLNSINIGLHVPPGIWCEQHSIEDTVLAVLCDQPYDENDYLRDYSAFLDTKKVTA